MYDPNPPSAPALSAPGRDGRGSGAQLDGLDRPAGGSSLAGYRVYRDGTLIATTSSIIVHRQRLGGGSGHVRVLGRRLRRCGQHDLVGAEDGDRRHERSVRAGAVTAAARPPTRSPCISWAAAERWQRADLERHRALRRLPRRGARGQLDHAPRSPTPARRPNSTSSYTVVAVDAAGNRSPASSGRRRRLRHERPPHADQHRRHDTDRDAHRS